jgi:RNA polymerase sigma-70 factor, ECF subfamily
VDRAGDAQLVEGAARGDRSAIAAVWDRYASFVRTMVYGALGPDSALDDLVQEVFLAFVRGAKSIVDGAQLRNYLAGVAVRLVALEIRRRKVRRWVHLSPSGELPDRPTPPRDIEGRETLRALYRVLERLSTRRRLAFVLRHVQGLEMLDAARALEVSESTLRRELSRARQQVMLGAQREPALAEFLQRTSFES